MRRHWHSCCPTPPVVVEGGEANIVAVDSLRVGDVLSIQPGDVVPVDGAVLSGQIELDESMLTGESLPVFRSVDSPVFAGAVTRSGNATVRVTQIGASTSLAEIGRMLERARSDRPPIATLADRIATWFVTECTGHRDARRSDVVCARPYTSVRGSARYPGRNLSLRTGAGNTRCVGCCDVPARQAGLPAHQVTHTGSA